MDEAPASVGPVLRQARAGVAWAKENVALALELGLLAAEQAEEAAARLGAAAERLAAAEGDAGEVHEEADAFLADSRGSDDVHVLLLEAGGRVRVLLEEAAVIAGEETALRDDIRAAGDEIDAAMAALDPSRDAIRDAIAMSGAADDMRVQVLRDVAQQTAKHLEVLRRASEKLKRLRASHTGEYAALRARLLEARRDDAPQLLTDLMRLGLDRSESKALLNAFVTAPE